MTTMRTALLVLAVSASVLGGCGRKDFPVPPLAEGELPQLQPGGDGLAGAPRIVPSTSSTISPQEITRNPNADRRRFVLDPLLN